MGGKCAGCGAETDLELDHRSPAEKLDHRIWSWAPARLAAELKKCRLLCRRCHWAKSNRDRRKAAGWKRAGLRVMPRHGSHSRYREGCRCPACKAYNCLRSRRSRGTRLPVLRMRGIKSSGTGPERALRGALRRIGISFEKNVKGLPGTPDIVLRYATGPAAVFVHGCFWHRCPDHFRWPRTRRAWWIKKILGNVCRDVRAARALRKAGWRHIVAWEHEIRMDPDACARRILKEAGIVL